MMNKLYPKLAYPEEIKAYYLEDLPRTPIKTLVTIYKTYMGALQAEGHDFCKQDAGSVYLW